MGVNNLSYEQISAVLNDLTKQVTGQDIYGPVDSANFTSVATKLLQTGTDPLLNAISQMVGKTIFSVRPYNRKLSGIQVDSQRWGYITRKLAVADKDLENDASFQMNDGGQYSHWYVNMPNVLQLNYYGQNAFEKSVSIFKNQLDGAFSSRESFGSFIGMVMQNASDMIEQSRESMARMTLGNFITGKINAGEENVVHLVTEYNVFINADPQLSWAEIKASASEYERFIKWMYGRVATISEMMTERTVMYQINVAGKPITRHTPKDRQKIYLISDFMNAMKSMVLSGTYNDDFLRYADTEAVNFWQSPDKPMEINIKPAYIDATGAIVASPTAQNVKPIFAVLLDRDAAGVNFYDQAVEVSPYEAAGQYYNYWYHDGHRYYNDVTENAVVFLMD